MGVFSTPAPRKRKNGFSTPVLRQRRSRFSTPVLRQRTNVFNFTLESPPGLIARVCSRPLYFYSFLSLHVLCKYCSTFELVPDAFSLQRVVEGFLSGHTCPCMDSFWDVSVLAC